MELAAALHHSRDVGPGKNDGLRAQTTASSGKRPAPLEEVSEPQVGAVTVGYVAAPGPLLEVPSMAGGGNIYGTALRFLLEHCLRMKTLLLEEERRKEEEKDKRGGKRKLLEACGYDAVDKGFALSLRCPLRHAVFPSVGRPKMRGIMAGMYQKDCCALTVVSGSVMCKVGFTGDYALRSVIPSVVARPKMLDIMASMDQKNSYLLQVQKVHFLDKVIDVPVVCNVRCWP